MESRVFISCGEAGVRRGFASHLEKALRGAGTNVQMLRDKDEALEGIEGSGVVVVVVIFSKRCTESARCFNELSKVEECMNRGGLIRCVPVLYLVSLSDANSLATSSSDDKTKSFWTRALSFISRTGHLQLPENSEEADFVKEIVSKVIGELTAEESGNPDMDPSQGEGNQPGACGTRNNPTGSVVRYGRSHTAGNGTHNGTAQNPKAMVSSGNPVHAGNGTVQDPSSTVKVHAGARTR